MSEQITQSNYEETKYADQSWEIVGAPPVEEIFFPLDVEVIASAGTKVGPMFADYGGLSKEGATRRWHLPEGVAYKPPEEQASQSKEEEQKLVSEEQLEQARKEAYEQGLNEGRQAASEENAARLAQMQNSLSILLQDLKNSFEEKLSALELAAVDLAVDISQKLILQAVEINPEYLVPLIKEALLHVGNAQIQRVRVSAQDLEFIKIVGLEKQLREKNATWTFEADETIRSGCVVDSSAGEVDFSLDQAWERVRDQVVRSTHE